MEIHEATAADAAIVGELAHRLVWEIAPGARDQITLEGYQSCAAALLEGDSRFCVPFAKPSIRQRLLP